MADSQGLNGRGRGRLRLAKRAGWNVVDQALSSLTNVVLAFLIARSVDAESFGAFALAFAVFALLIGVERALVGEPLSIRFSGAPPEEMRRAAQAAVGLAVLGSLAVAVVTILVGALVGGLVGEALVALGFVLPLLLAQDAWRMVFFACRRPAAAAANDLVWALVQLSLISLVLSAGVRSTGPLVLVWGLSAGVAALYGVRQFGAWPMPHRGIGWLRAHFDLTRYFVAEFALTQGAVQLLMFLVAGLGTVQAVGALRGAQVVLGPVGILATGFAAFAVPELARRAAMAGRTRVRVATGLALVVTAGASVWGVLVLLLPWSVGVALLGSTWSGAHAVLLASVIGSAVNCLSIGPTCAINAMGRSDVTFRLSAVQSPLLITFGVAGLWLGGTPGAAWGITAAYACMVPLWFGRLWRLAYPEAPSPAPAGGRVAPAVSGVSDP